MIITIVGAVTILLYGIVCWSSYKKPEILKYIVILIMLWGVGTIFLFLEFPDAFLLPLPFSSRVYGMVIPFLYILYLKLKNKNINDSVKNDISLMVATGFLFGGILSAFFLLLYVLIFFLRRKKKLPYVVVIFPIVSVYYAIIIATIIIILVQSGGESTLSMPIVIEKI